MNSADTSRGEARASRPGRAAHPLPLSGFDAANGAREGDAGETALGLYIHIPWCHTRCIYCDFNTYIDGGEDLKAQYQEAVRREIREAGEAMGRPPLHTLFFGGGTPTTLAPEQLIELLETVRESFQLQPGAEVTTEANPGTLSRSYLRALREGGINRLSLGVQSFSDDELRLLSRLHDASEARAAVEAARAAGFDNLSLDLIFNLPFQSLEQWRRNVREALRLAPEHFSFYSLIVEPGTPLQRQVAAGQMPEPDDDLAADMYALAIDELGAAGYSHYEISNWARAGDEPPWATPRLASAHNLIYWRNQPYLGIGAGAYGTVGGQRWANVKRPQRYIERVRQGRGPGAARDEQTLEEIDPVTERAEHMMLGLRLLREGVGSAAFERRYGERLQDRFGWAIVEGHERELLEWIEAPGEQRLRLTARGRFLANAATLPFLEELPGAREG